MACEHSIKFFSLKKSERFAFKKRDAAFLPTRERFPRGSLIPVFVFYSDFFPELVQSALSKCVDVIKKCPHVFMLVPSTIAPAGKRKDDIAFEGRGSDVAASHFSFSTIVRTLDAVKFKLHSPGRKKDLSPVERELWSCVEPILDRFRTFCSSLIKESIDFDTIEDEATIKNAIRGSRPWCFSVSEGKVVAKFYYVPEAGLIIREYPGLYDALPLATLPRRLSISMGSRPCLSELLSYLKTLAGKIQNSKFDRLLRAPTNVFLHDFDGIASL